MRLSSVPGRITKQTLEKLDRGNWLPRRERVILVVGGLTSCNCDLEAVSALFTTVIAAFRLTGLEGVKVSGGRGALLDG